MVNTKFDRISNVDSVACQTWPAHFGQKETYDELMCLFVINAASSW